MPFVIKISGVLQIFLKSKEEKLSGVLQIIMNAEEEKNIWSAPDITKKNKEEIIIWSTPDKNECRSGKKYLEYSRF